MSVSRQHHSIYAAAPANQGQGPGVPPAAEDAVGPAPARCSVSFGRQLHSIYAAVLTPAFSSSGGGGNAAQSLQGQGPAVPRATDDVAWPATERCTGGPQLCSIHAAVLTAAFCSSGSGGDVEMAAAAVIMACYSATHAAVSPVCPCCSRHVTKTAMAAAGGHVPPALVTGSHTGLAAAVAAAFVHVSH